ncbi:DUF1648 domain-containing protein [Nocardioides sp.]|uniref:DUF1648 domain-containing protein n=1 Tax=Nocardioides sp. TaxID=35761 RepID=UPI002736838E|nr:DUF1648 domain-containing protein [Nocardioides sp.]MDP3891337.1 DUF1648 domain-containing protein [Nocardioides sp.]
MTRSGFLVASGLLYAVTWAWGALVLPSRVPVHFDASGAADRVVGRGEALVAFGVLGAAVFALMLVMTRSTARMSFAWFNIPHKDWWTATEERRARARAMSGEDIAVLGGATMLLLVVVLAVTIGAAEREESRLGPVFLLALAVYLLGLAGFLAHMHLRRYRPDLGEDPA